MNQTTKSINRESTKLFLLNYFPILIFFALSIIMIITSLKIFLFFIITALLSILTCLTILIIKKKNKQNNESFIKKYQKANLSNVIQILDSNLTYCEDTNISLILTPNCYSFMFRIANLSYSSE